MDILLQIAIYSGAVFGLVGLVLSIYAVSVAREALAISKHNPESNHALSERMSGFRDRLEMAVEESKSASSKMDILDETMKKHRNSSNGTIGAQTKKISDLEVAISQIVQALNNVNSKPEYSGDGANQDVSNFPR